MGEYAVAADSADASGLRFGIAVARFNEPITSALLEGARRELTRAGVADDDVTIVWVPGAFELPLVAKHLATRGGCDAVVCLGAIIRGETAHFDYVCDAAASGLMRVSLDTGVPCAFGILTCDTKAQAEARAGGDKGNKGDEAADAVVAMINLLASARAMGPGGASRS